MVSGIAIRRRRDGVASDRRVPFVAWRGTVACSLPIASQRHQLACRLPLKWCERGDCADCTHSSVGYQKVGAKGARDIVNHAVENELIITVLGARRQ